MRWLVKCSAILLTVLLLASMVLDDARAGGQGFGLPSLDFTKQRDQRPAAESIFAPRVGTPPPVFSAVGSIAVLCAEPSLYEELIFATMTSRMRPAAVTPTIPA